MTIEPRNWTSEKLSRLIDAARDLLNDPTFGSPADRDEMSDRLQHMLDERDYRADQRICGLPNLNQRQRDVARLIIHNGIDDDEEKIEIFASDGTVYVERTASAAWDNEVTTWTMDTEGALHIL